MIQKSIHPLQIYKGLLEKFDISYIDSKGKPEFIVTMKDSGNRVVATNAQEQNKLNYLINDLAFAKSWIKACGKNLSVSGETYNGYDKNQWEYAFNDGARATYDALVSNCIRCSSPLPNDKIVTNWNMLQEIVNSSTNYSHTSDITQSLIKEQKNPWQLDFVQKSLLEGVSLPNSSLINMGVLPQEDIISDDMTK